jgi:tRNA threonylcarbamoyladenosine biosynthesis protein TsaE
VNIATPEEMRAAAARVGEVARAGDLIVLTGPLGAGKTVFAQGLARGLGVRERVTSPTFVIAHVHRDGRVPFVHVDAYRLSSVLEVEDLDLPVAESVTAVEWGSGLVEGLAESWLEVRIDRHDDDTRTVTYDAHGDWAGRLPRVAGRVAGGSVRALVETYADVVRTLPYVLVAWVDSGRPERHPWVVPGEEVVDLAHRGLLNGFDEVWVLAGPDADAPPDGAAIVAPVRLDEGVPEATAAWLARSGARLGLGDGEGLNYVATDVALAAALGLPPGAR